MTRFEDFAKQDLSTIHHALRMLALNPSEIVKASDLADEAWDEISRRAEEDYRDACTPESNA